MTTPQTIGGVERAVGRGPTEHLRDELDLTYGAIKSGHKFTPSVEWIEHICTLAKASASTIEHQLSVIGELRRSLDETLVLAEAAYGDLADSRPVLERAQAALFATQALSHPIIGDKS